MVLSGIVFFLLKIFIFVVIIYTMHQGWEFIKNNYSVPKKKNVFNSEIEKYKQIIQTIHEGSPSSIIDSDVIFENKEVVNSMNDELEEFMREEVNKIRI